MVKTLNKPPKGKAEIVREIKDTGEVIRVKGRHLAEEYPRGIMKIASYSGVVRRMDCGSKKCSGFDEIVNLYVYPDGIVDDYPNNVIDPLTTSNEISKQSTHKHGSAGQSIWGKREKKEGESSRTVPRVKKHSVPPKRNTHKKNKRK